MTPPTHQRALPLTCWGAAAAGVLALLLAWSQFERGEHSLALLIGFGVALSLVELFPLHLRHDGESEALRLEEAFFVPMAVLLQPAETLLVIGIAMVLASVSSRRASVLKVAFNTGMIVSTAGLGLAVAALLGLDGSFGARDVAAVFLGGLVFCAASALAVSVVIGLSQGVPFRDVAFDGARVRVATWLGSLSLGVLVLVAAEQRPVVLFAAAVPVVVLQYAYRGSLAQWQERRQAQALYDAARRIHGTVESRGVRVELEEAARRLLAAGSARVVTTDEEVPGGALRADVDAGLAVEVGNRATGGTWTSEDGTRLQALAAVAGGALANARLYEQLHAITNNLGEGVLAVDPDGVVTFANPAADSMLGWPAGALVGREVAATLDPGGLVPARGGGEWVHLRELRSGSTLRLDEYTVARRDGTPLDVALTVSPVLREGAMVGAVVALRDVTERKALERRLVHQAFHDQLTGLPSRALFLDRLEHARTRSAETASTQAVLFVDVDRFKLINDSLGHRIGDDVLCTVASRLVGAVRHGDTVARFGGDEFAVLLEEMAGPAEATATAERMMRSLRLPVIAGDREVVLSVSIGIAVSEPGDHPTDLLAAADIAMYDAKRAGKDRFAFAAPDADDLALARLDLEMELRLAISEGELEVYYQPVLHAQTGGLYGFEALVRWRHPRLGLVPPSHFMDLAEDTGLVLPLGEWVLEQACRTARAWRDQHPGDPLVMAVNLSARQFQDPDLCTRVAAALRTVGLEPSALVLEITETVVMGDTERTLATLRALKRLGVRLAIDDFGTGYSSLSYLKRFPVDIVKIDKSFVDGLGDSPVDREIVAAVIRLAAAVGMQTVAEGVETPTQLEQLRVLGCSLVQGFLIAPPQPLADMERALARGRLVVPAPRHPAVRPQQTVA